jgi:hypothetical protein
MKFIKLTKTGWLILAAGVFVVVLGSLGVTRTQQLKEKSQLDEDLRNSTEVLEKLQATDLSNQRDDLQQKVEEGQVLLQEAAKRLDETVVSVDVSDELFDIAEYCGVTVMRLSTTPIKENVFEGIGLDVTNMNVLVNGNLSNLVDFIVSLDNDYTTGLVKSFQINVPHASSSNESPSANVQIMIYSYEEDNNG